MFERYNERARRVIFFARYEASHYGSPYIETEHLLLGLLREDPSIAHLVRNADIESVRKQIDDAASTRPATSTSVDLPLSNESKLVLQYAAEEADRLNHRHIGTEHLLLGVLREQGCFAAKILRERGADLAQLRGRIEKQTERKVPAYSIPTGSLPPQPSMIEIHGVPRLAASILRFARRYREEPWQWDKRAWHSCDAVRCRKTGKFSFDLKLAEDAANFELVKGGWKKEHCVICHWELYETPDDASHGTGYTNGRHWVCTECYERFWDRPDFISGSFAEIT
jgi:hypothetical protein